MQKHTSGANTAPVNVVLITLDNHMSAAVDDARRMLADELPNLHLSVHAATDWNDNPDKLQACKDDIARATSSSPRCCSSRSTSRPSARRWLPAAITATP
jgi:hypothetical protein